MARRVLHCAVWLITASAAARAADRPQVPLCPGLTIVTAVNQPDGDYESIKRVISVDGQGVLMRYSSERSVVDEFSGSDKPVLTRTDVNRRLLPADIESGPIYLVSFQSDMPAEIPKTTAFGTSRAVLKALRERGEATLGIIKDLLPEPSLDPASLSYVYTSRMDYKLQRDPAPATVDVLVNGKPARLPAIRATGETLGVKVEFYFLDDPDNPLTLKFRLGIGAYAELNKQMIAAAGRPAYPSDDHDSLRVVRLSYDCGTAEWPLGEGGAAGQPPSDGLEEAATAEVAALESALATREPVDVYDIFFSFNSAELRPESDETLQAIAAVLARHPDWKMSIAGHTDSIAGDEFNLTLSNRRAAAVKNELVKRFKIDPAGLTTHGFGESRPRDTNDTLEGRAMNRRVELQRM